MKTLKRLFFVLSVGVLLTSCSSSKKTTKKSDEQKPSTHTETVVVEKQRLYNTCSFKIKGSFHSIPFSGTVRTSYDSIYWVSVSSLGIEAARAKLTQDSLYLIDKLNKRYAQMDYKRAQVYLGIPITFDFIQEMFTDTVLVKSFTTPKFQATVVKTLQSVQGVRLPEQIDVSGKIDGKSQKISIKVKDAILNKDISYPFSKPKDYKIIK